MNVAWNMTIGEIGQIAALTTAIAISLYFGVKSLRHTKDLQEKQFKHDEEIRKREDRQKLLDEIIQWAIDISKCGLEVELPSKFERTPQGYLDFRNRMTQLQNVLRALLRKSKYISAVVLPSWQVLNIIIKELQTQLDDHVTQINEYIEGNIANESKLEALDKHRSTINGLVAGVIDEATQIKIQDLD